MIHLTTGWNGNLIKPEEILIKTKFLTFLPQNKNTMITQLTYKEFGSIWSEPLLWPY